MKYFKILFTVLGLLSVFFLNHASADCVRGSAANPTCQGGTNFLSHADVVAAWYLNDTGNEVVEVGGWNDLTQVNSVTRLQTYHLIILVTLVIAPLTDLLETINGKLQEMRVLFIFAVPTRNCLLPSGCALQT